MATWTRIVWTALLLAALALVGVQPAMAQEPGIHIVQVGESLTAIATRYGTTPSAIAEANGLANQNFIYSGQRLRIPGAGSTGGTAAAAGGVHIVRAGESLTLIAQSYGVTPAAIANANSLANQNFIYSGQRLIIPGGVPSAAGATSAVTSGTGTVHVVRVGETLASIAARYGVSARTIASANGIVNQNLIFAGQRLNIPGGSATTTTPPATQPAAGSPTDGRWIDVNLTAQTVVAYAGQTAMYSALASTGLPGTPTVTGRYTILSKYPAVHMSGPGYSLPNVPWTMFFYKGYALHGAYWHNKFGQPMSHGCVNLSIEDAKWFYDFASIGTPVVVHY